MGMTNNNVDEVLMGMVERNMKDIYLSHARQNNMSETVMEQLEKHSWQDVATVVTIMYGDPTCIKEN